MCYKHIALVFAQKEKKKLFFLKEELIQCTLWTPFEPTGRYASCSRKIHTILKEKDFFFPD